MSISLFISPFLYRIEVSWKLCFKMPSSSQAPTATDLPSTTTAYGEVWTWDEGRSENQQNLAAFLKQLATDGELQEQIKAVKSQQEVIDIAKKHGINFTVDTLEARARTLPFVDNKELEEVKWARWGEDNSSRRWEMNVWIKL